MAQLENNNTVKISNAEVAGMKLQNSVQKNSKALIYAIVAIILLVGGYFAYKAFVLAPKEEKAQVALISAERYFEVDSFNKVLNGDGQSQGALAIIKKFSGTKAANLANFYAGMSYLKTGDANNAIKYLSDFNGEGTVVGQVADGALGDAYMDANKIDKGIEMYKKAASNENNEFSAALYTFRAGLASELAGKPEDAKKYYKEIKEKYPRSNEAAEVDKYLARLGEVNID